MNKGLYLSVIASLTTLSGIFFMINYKDKNKIDRIITISLSIAFINMLLVSIFDIFLNTIKNMPNKAFLSVFIYLVINYTIIYLFLKICHKIKKFKVGEGKLYFLGVINTITLLLHNIPEGIITCTVTNINYKLGLKLTSSIIMHNIPEGISIAVPIYYSTKSKKRGFIYVLIAALGEVIGALFSIIFLKSILNQKIIDYMLISVSSIMILIALEEIFPQIISKNKKSVLVGILIGIILFIVNIVIN